MKQISAVEWLKKELEDYGSNSHLSLDWNTFDELCEQAKEMEKQQIIDAYVEGCSDSILDESTDKTRSEDYYNENYGK